MPLDLDTIALKNCEFESNVQVICDHKAFVTKAYDNNFAASNYPPTSEIDTKIPITTTLVKTNTCRME